MSNTIMHIDTAQSFYAENRTASDTVVVSCPVCSSPDTVQFRTGIRHYHYPLAGVFATRKCTRCEVEWIFPQPDAAAIASFYPAEYYAHQDDVRPGLWQKMIRALGLRVRSGEPSFSEPGTMLDIGCGTGDALRLYKDRGWSVVGVNYGAEDEVAPKNSDIILGDFLKLDFGDKQFDYVRMNHTLEHMPRPLETIRKAYSILKPGGKLLIGVPNSSSWGYRFFGDYWWYYGVPLHLFTYNRRSLSLLLEHCGFHIVRFRLNSDYAGISGSIQIYLNRNTNRSSYEGWVFHSKILRILAHLIAKLIDRIGRGDCMEMTAVRPKASHV